MKVIILIAVLSLMGCACRIMTGPEIVSQCRECIKNEMQPEFHSTLLTGDVYSVTCRPTMYTGFREEREAYLRNQQRCTVYVKVPCREVK